MNTILVTGAGGFLGRSVARHFAGASRVVGVDVVPEENAQLSALAAYHRVQLPDSRLGEILREHQPSLVIHCAGRASVPMSVNDPASDFHDGVAVTFDLLNALREHAPQSRFLLFSSAAVYGQPQSLPVSEEHAPAPLSPYGFHKWQCEILCAEFAKVYGLRTASLRIFSAYGPGLRRQVMWDICQKALVKKSLKLQGTGAESRDFIHATDIARAAEIVANHAPMNGEVFNVSTGREVTIRDLSAMLLRALGVGIEPEFDGVVPSGVPHNWRADVSRLNALGFHPGVPLEQGAQKFAAWCRAELAVT